MSKEFPTLIDRVYASTFSRETEVVNSDMDLRHKLFAANRFVLDDAMSSFLADLANTAFMGGNVQSRFRAVEAMRIGSRAPFPMTWIEYDLRRSMSRAREMGVRTHNVGGTVALEDMPEREGWLIQRHPGVETAFSANVFSYDREMDEKGYNCWAFPWTYHWTTDDTPPPYPNLLPARMRENATSTILTGVVGYDSPFVAASLCRWATKYQGEGLVDLMMEWMGIVRRMWALLSTLGDLPLGFKEIRQSRGFYNRGNYKRFLDHKTVTLTVPAPQHAKLARKVVAMARRRAHSVRGHWRLDWKHPGRRDCRHEWRMDQTCECGAHRTWIREHQRGDATLGFVTHDYRVSH